MVIDPGEKWEEVKGNIIAAYNRHPFIKALAVYAAENGREACRDLYGGLYVKHFSGYGFKARLMSSKLEHLSPHSVPGTRLILGVCSNHNSGKKIFHHGNS